jgi:hypothetical protein
MIDEYNGEKLDAIFSLPCMLSLAHAKEMCSPEIKTVHCGDTQPIALTMRILITIDGLAAEMLGEEKC